MKKKVNVFGKSVPVFLIALIAVTGFVSAALLTYFGVITGSVTLSQSVLFDGHDITTLTPVVETMVGVAGEIFYNPDHTLKNNADTWILVDVNLENTCPGPDPTNCDGANIYPEYKLVSLSGGAAGVGDEDDVHLYLGSEGGVLWNNFVNASFDYNVTDGSARVPHVNVWLRKAGLDDVQLTTWNGGSPLATIVDGRATYTKAMFTTLSGGSPDAYADYSVREVRVQSGNPSLDPSPDVDDQTVYVSHVQVNSGTDLTQVELPTQTYANIPGRVVEFRMVYGFEYNSYPGTYTTITNVDYIGTITASGVTINGVLYP